MKIVSEFRLIVTEVHRLINDCKIILSGLNIIKLNVKILFGVVNLYGFLGISVIIVLNKCCYVYGCLSDKLKSAEVFYRKAVGKFNVFVCYNDICI